MLSKIEHLDYSRRRFAIYSCRLRNKDGTRQQQEIELDSETNVSEQIGESQSHFHPKDNTAVPAGSGPIEISDRFRMLDPRNITVSTIVGVIFSSVLTVGSLVGLVTLWLSLGLGTVWYSIAGGALFVLVSLWILTFMWPPLEHRHASWRLDSEGLEIKRGVLWRHHITIPLGRVQHADVSQGPIQRTYELGTLKVHTAGTHNASVELEGLSHSQALELRDLIVHQRKGENVV